MALPHLLVKHFSDGTLGIPNHHLDMVAHRNVGTIVRVINPVANDAPPATGYYCQRIYH